LPHARRRHDVEAHPLIDVLEAGRARSWHLVDSKVIIKDL
jgi:hypothetical protein